MAGQSRSLKVKIHGFGLTDKGGRPYNQDSFIVNDSIPFYLVADGIGGLSDGEHASLFTSDRMNEILDRIVEFYKPGKHDNYQKTMGEFGMITLDNETILRHALWFTNKELHKLTREGRKMGTTLVGVWFRDNQIIFMNVGDSRAYIVWEDDIQRITHDHSQLEEIIREGELTPDEAKKAYKRNIITRGVGYKSKVMGDFYTRPLYPGLRILLCSDGLHDPLSQDELLRHSKSATVEDGCYQLIRAAREAGEKKVKRALEMGRKVSYDNITAVLIDVGGYASRFAADEKDDEAHFTIGNDEEDDIREEEDSL